MDNRTDSEEFIPETDSPIIEIHDAGEEAEPVVPEPDIQVEDLPVIDLNFELEEEMPQEEEIDDEVLANISSNLASQVKGEYESEEKEPEKKAPIGLIVAAIVVFALLSATFLLVGTKSGQNLLLRTDLGKKVLAVIIGDTFGETTNYDDGSLTPTLDPSLFLTPTEGALELTPEPTTTVELTPTPEITDEPVVTEPVEEDQTVYNFLLLGIEDVAEIEGQPKTDMVMLATVDTKSGMLHLTTILRDLLVQIPGYTDNTIASVYSEGGISALYDTMEKNFGIVPDGYLLVSYQGFRDMIDLLGGVTIELTAREATYLNKTNYISKPENRTVVAGENHLNGDQVLGYCRIRHVETETKEYNDIGRTARQRKVLYSIFEQLKNKSVTDAYQILKSCLSYVTTDITGEECTAYLEEFLNMPAIGFAEHRIPMDGTYQTNVVRKMSVLVADMPVNREALLALLYPEEEETLENGVSEEGDMTKETPDVTE